MTIDRWDRIQSVFLDALECPPHERPAFLDRACEGDSILRREVESLLACDAPESRLVAIPTLPDPAAPEPDMAGRRIGPYRLIRLIGHGGMGAVYLGVRDDDQYRKQVAIKLLKRGMDTDFMLGRFRQERQILANLEHPFIARLMDGGATDDGLPYFVMEFVDGVPITTYCTEKNLSIAERLRLFRLVCEAVQYAHQNLVVHRDLKPGNILTTREGIPKLLDFGIAKVIDPATAADHTRRELRILTPDYASPEQVKGLPISTTSDIYSLGAVLYELLTGRRAHRISSSALIDLEAVICDVDPPKPSLAAGKASRRQLAGDLDNIVLTAMRKDPLRRYASVAEFSEDLRRHMDGLPVTAQEDRWSYRTRKFIRRNRLAAGAALLIAASLIGGMITTTIQARRAERRFLLARQLAQSVVAEVSANGSLARVPGSTAARASIIQTVIRYLDGLAQDPGRDPAFELEIANAYRSVAEVEGSPLQQNLGRSDSALAHYQKAIAIYESVFLRFSSRSEIKRRALGGLVSANIQAGDIEARAEDVVTPKARLQRVLSLATEETARDPEALGRGTWVWIYFRLGGFDMRDGAPEQALVNFRKALELCLQWVPTESGPNARNTLRGAYTNLAGAQLKNGDLLGARENYTRALQLVEQATRLPDATVYERSVLSGAHKNLGDLLGHPADFNLGDRAGALSHYRVSIAIDEALAAADPADVRAQDDLANTYFDAAAILMEEQPGEALRLHQKASAMARELLSLAPVNNTKYRQTLALNEMGAGECLAKLDRNQEALTQLTSALDKMSSLATVAEDRMRTLIWTSQLHRDIGTVLLATADEQGALEHFRLALAGLEELLRRTPANLYAQRFRADAFEALGQYYAALARRRGEPKTEARVWLQKSLRLWQDWVNRKIAEPYAAVRARRAAALLASIDTL